MSVITFSLPAVDNYKPEKKRSKIQRTFLKHIKNTGCKLFTSNKKIKIHDTLAPGKKKKEMRGCLKS